MNTKWKVGIAAVVLALLPMVLLTEGILFPGQLQPKVLPIQLHSVVPTETGRQAIYEIRNESRSTVEVWEAVSLNVGRPESFGQQEARVTPVSIKAGETAKVSVPVPREKQWQAMIRVARRGAKEGTIVFSEWSPEPTE